MWHLTLDSLYASLLSIIILLSTYAIYVVYSAL